MAQDRGRRGRGTPRGIPPLPRACSTCLHPRLDAIDRALVGGDSPKVVAAKFGASVQSLQRHVSNHLPVTLAKSPRFESEVKADRLLDEVAELKARAVRLLDTAETGVDTLIRGKGEDDVVKIPDLRAAAMAIREARGCVELFAKLRGELPDGGTTVNVLVTSPEWATTQRAVLAALQPYPEAKAAVLQALKPLAVAA